MGFPFRVREGDADVSAVIDKEPSRAMYWTGWVLSLIPGLFLLSGSVTAMMMLPMVVEGMAPFGFPISLLPVIGGLELLCSVLYLIPRTAPIGAILMTAYMGGAVVTHLRIGQTIWFVPVIFGVLVWAGLLLRRPALRAAMLGL
jgi:hypothetical protein